MKNSKLITINVVALFVCCSLHAQDITLSYGDKTNFELIKGSEPINFVVDGNRYFFSAYYKNAAMNYNLYSYDAQGKIIFHGDVELNPGVFNNTYSIDQVLPFGNRVYAMIEHLDKAAGKNSLLARTIDKSGVISKDETEVMNIPFEKMLNSGFNYAAVSPSQTILAVVGEMPFEKEQPAKFKVALFDKDLKKVKDEEITLPGENTKNKSISVAVGDNGTIYLIKKTSTKNGEIALNIYQWREGTDVKEYSIDLTPPAYITSYAYTVNEKSELVLSGTYYERQTVSTGEQKIKGIFFFSNKNLNENNFKTFALDNPVENLTAQKILLNGNTIFLKTEQYKEEKVTGGAATTIPEYNYTYTHKSNFIIGMDADGSKKFQIEAAKDFTAQNENHLFVTASFVCNNKLTLIYNDRAEKYLPGATYNILAVMVQITNDGLMQAPLIFDGELELEGGSIYPYFSVQDTNDQLSFLMGNGSDMKLVTLKITD